MKNPFYTLSVNSQKQISFISTIKTLVLTLIFGIFFSADLFSQAPACPSINSQVTTGPTSVICTGQCAHLTASVVPVNLTTTYSVSSIPYTPFSYTTGTSILANQDDVWSSTLNLGFPFCFYGNTYNQCKVGSNGQVTFSTAIGSSNNWAISTAMPSLTDLPGNTICAAFRDIDPTSSGNIYYTMYGTAPCRSFVVSWNNIPMFSNPGSCSGIANSTFQMVMYETTNYIDVFIQNSSACPGWNSGYGIIGVQNFNASLGTVPPGRNFPSAWTAINEAWRFTPTGLPTYTVDWQGPSGSMGSSLTQTVCPLTTTQYTANMSVAACGGPPATYSSVVTISVVPGPSLAVTSASICGGSVATLTASGAPSYTWQTGGSTINTATYSPAATTAYTVFGSTGGLCVSQGTGTVFVNPAPTPTIQSNSPVCEGATINFTGGGGTVYSWIGPGGFISNSQNPSINPATLIYNGNFTLTVTDANGCMATTTKAYVVNPTPIVAAAGSSICVGQTANLTANGGVGYSWTGPGGFTSNQQNPTITNAQAFQSGIYNVTVTDVNGCMNSAFAQVAINTIPAPTASNNSPICIDNILSFTGTGGLNYSWAGPSGFSSVLQNPTLTANTTAFTGNYTLTVSDNIGCTSSTVIPAIVNPIPTVNIITGVNKGCVPMCATFTCAVSAVQNCSWTFGDGGTSTSTAVANCYNIPGNFPVSVTATDINGCTNVATQTVTVYPIPVADFVYNPIKPVVNDEVSFTDASHNATISSWNWYFMNTSAHQSTSQNPTFVYEEVGNYVIALVVKSDAGCKDTILKSIVIGEDFGIYIPNTFTPNGDGLNDLFHVKGYGVTKFEMQVYDRWGEKVFISSDMNDSWDGTHSLKGLKTIQEGVYVWRIKLTNVFGKSKELTGHVTLIK